MAKCIICGGALWHTDRCPMRDHEISTWEEMQNQAIRPIGPVMRSMLDQMRILEQGLHDSIRNSPHRYTQHMNGPESARDMALWNGHHYVIERVPSKYDTDKLKDKMRRGIIWTGWEDAAKRNKKRNG